MKISILTENTANKRGMLAEHGLSVLIETGGETDRRRILFDTGQSDVFWHNARRMDISLENTDAVVLSHGHYDHTGGLEELCKYNKKKPDVYLRENALEDKLCKNSDGISFRKIGIPWRERKLPVSFHYTNEKEEIFPGIFVLSNIPYVVPEEPESGLFFRESPENGTDRLPDRMTDEQLLVIRTEKGLAVFAGCAHAGILNCIAHVKNNFPGEKLYLLLAGMHLRSCSAERVEKTISGLADCGFSKIIPVHCTGIEAIVRMREALGEVCLSGEAGARFEL